MSLRILLAVFTAAFLFGCGGGDKTCSSGVGPSSTPLAEPKGPMPPLPGKSSFTPDLGDIKAEPTEAPQDAVSLRWDFVTPRTMAYDYTQTVKNTSEMGGQSGITQNLESSGTLLMKSERDKTARMVLKDIKAQMNAAVPGKSEISPASMDLPVQVVSGIQENGSISGGNSEQEVLVKLLFPLPPGPLKQGETAEIPVKIPFNMMGSVLDATGLLRTKLVRFVKVGGRLCAQLETVVDVGKLEIPPEVESKAQFEVKGITIALFDLEEHRFVAASQALMLAFRIDIPLPKIDLKGEGPAVSLPKVMRMVTDSDNLINIRWSAEKTKSEAAKPKPVLESN